MPPKKKPRTPTPPRRVQAPQARKSAPVDDLGRRQRAILYGVAGAGVVGLIVVVLVIVLSGGGVGSSKHVAALMQKANCRFKSVPGFVPKGQSTHVNSLTAKLPWNTDPPSNGQRYPLWAVWGFYTQPVNPHMVVHNEEHGGVVYWWGTQVPQSTVTKLKALYNEQPDGTFGTPYAKLGSKVAITAWTGNPANYQRNGYYGEGHIATCPSYTPAVEVAFRAFRNLYRGHGPEGIPLSADEPGMGPNS